MTVADGALVSMALLVAVTEQVYVVPFVRPMTVTGEPPPEPAKPPGLHVARKFVIELPPLLTEGVKAIDAVVSPGVALPMTGAPGAEGLMVILAVICGAGLKFALPG